MADSFKQTSLKIISGENGSLRGSVARALTSIIEPFYAASMSVRNRCYDRGIFRIHDLGRPTVSVGNITTGGTGKTPVVQWLANRLREQHKHPAILLRGYGATDATESDEAQLLDDALSNGSVDKIPVQPNPSRVTGAVAVLARYPEVDVFVLDDAFQHRKVRRDFNLVLISATAPFGYGHVLPRGLLREPLRGLDRADAFLITRCSLVSPADVLRIGQVLIASHPATPIYHADHCQSGLWLPSTQATEPMESLTNQKVYLAAAIGDPTAFAKQISASGADVVGSRWFHDHYRYTTADMESIVAAAKEVHASRLLTTAKDWVKMRATLNGSHIPVSVVQLEIRFHGDDEAKLLDQLSHALVPHS